MHRSLILALAVLAQTASAQRPDTIVKNITAPRYAGVATLVEEVKFGNESGADEYTFGEVSDVAVAKDGTVYVLDNTIYGIRVYDAKGKYIRTIGHKGQGPGETVSPSGIGVLPDGRVVLWDMVNWRVNVYSATGQSLTQWAQLAGGTAQASNGVRVDTAGNVLIRRPLPTSGAARGQLAPGWVWLKLRTSDGAPIDTIREPEWFVERHVLTASSSNASTSTDVPFDPRRIWALSPTGTMITGFPSRYAFEVHRTPRSVVSVRREVAAEKLPNAERDSARRAIEVRMRKVDPNWSWSGPDIPTTRPLYEGINTGEDGRIWVTRVKELVPGGGANFGMGSGRGMPASLRQAEVKDVPSRPSLFDVYEPDGTFIGQVRVPPKVQVLVRRGDYVWGAAYDDDDVATVRRYRIVWK